jgi:hypothetical protein
MSENYDALFAPGVEAKPEISSGPIDEYRPSAAKGKNNIYQSVIRFIPWHKNPKHESIKDKWSCWLVDPVTEQGRPVDCPSSVGKPSLLQDMYFKCKNSDNVMLQSKKDVFSRRKTFASLIQIIKDENNPELEGKILVWKYGVKIHEKIDAELKPVIGDKHDPFDLIAGKAFALIITKVSGYNNYDQSKFVDKRIPLVMPNNEGEFKMINENTDKKAVYEFVVANSPDLDKYGYIEWDQETLDYVNRVIVAVTGEVSGPSNRAAAINSSRTEDGLGSKVSGGKTSSGITSSDLDLGELGADTDPGDLDLPNLDDSNDGGLGIGGDLADALKGL